MAIAATFAVLVLVCACTSGRSRSTYFVHPVDGWKLKEALNLADGTPAQPSLDWYAEYERFPTPMRSELVVLSGHEAAALRKELASFALRPARVRDSAGQAGTSPDGQPSVVFFEPTDGYAVMALSNELGMDPLIQWMAEVQPASEEQWIDAGGRISR
jgi:hypothetical protein